MQYLSSLRVYLVTAAVLAFGAATALAQDYRVTQTAGQWVPVPPSATNIGLYGDDVSQSFSGTPFPIEYFGGSYSRFEVSTNGFVQFVNAGGAQCCSPQSGPLTGTGDGNCFPAWADDYGPNTANSSGLTAGIFVWSDGTAPNRRFFVSWINYSTCCTLLGTLNFQIQFYETGRIVFAYVTAGGWGGTARAFGVGIDEPNGNGFCRPPNGQTNGLYTFGVPNNDWQFDPRLSFYTGRVTYDRLVVSPTGLGTTVERNLPLAGAQVELRDTAGTRMASAITDSSGTYSIRARGLLIGGQGSVVVTSLGTAANVRTSAGGASHFVTLTSDPVSFDADFDVGTVNIDDTRDPAGSGRAPLAIVQTLNAAYAWAQTRTKDTIPKVEVLYGGGSSALSSFTPRAGPAAAVIRVCATTENPDAWDADILRKLYGRHVLGAIAKDPTTAYDDTFDKVTDAENAFAEAFGYYFNAVITRGSRVLDYVEPANVRIIELENPLPAPASPRGPDVAAWVAAGLYDLVDPANESWDTYDGTGLAGETVFQVVDTLTVPPTVNAFYYAWGAAGFAGESLARLFIHYGLVGDDADEPNDFVAEPTVVPNFGFIRNDRILSLYNSDWYQFTMPVATNKITARVVYNRATFDTTTIDFELLREDGHVIGKGAALPNYGPVELETGALPAGKYLLHVKHTGGFTIPTYAVQAYAQLAFSAAAMEPWTVGRPYNTPVNIVGGIPPYSLTVEIPFVKPPGLFLDGTNLRVTGSPAVAGTFNFILSARDSAVPNNIASGPQIFVVNPSLELRFGEFTAYALGKPIDRAIPHFGGTAPFTSTIVDGAFPAGLSMDEDDLRVIGTPTVAGSSQVAVHSVDVAGSEGSQGTTAVVCVPVESTADLAAGASACGFFLDAVKGSRISLAIKTERGQPKRPLRVLLLGSDGSKVLPAATRGGNGKGGVRGFVAPATGRYYCIVASEAGEATRLSATARITASKGGSGDSGPGVFGTPQTLAVEFGALPGAELTFVARPDRRSGLELLGLYMVAPNGTVVHFGEGEVATNSGSVVIKRTILTGGTWKVVIGARPGRSGSFTYAYRLDQPRTDAFEID